MFLRLAIVFSFMVSLGFNDDFEEAVKRFDAKNYVEAKVLFENVLKSNPSEKRTMEYLGDIAGHLKKWDEALFYYEKLKKNNPKIANYHYKFGGALGMKARSVNKFRALGMIDDIEASFLTAAQLDSKHIDCRWALVMFYIELPGIVGGSEKKAQKYADELMQLSKVDGYLAKGYIEEYFERYKKAELNYNKAHEIGNSKTTFQKLYNLYLNKIKDKIKADKLKEQFNNFHN